jgi:hypothetical protein
MDGGGVWRHLNKRKAVWQIFLRRDAEATVASKALTVGVEHAQVDVVALAEVRVADGSRRGSDSAHGLGEAEGYEAEHCESPKCSPRSGSLQSMLRAC